MEIILAGGPYWVVPSSCVQLLMIVLRAYSHSKKVNAFWSCGVVYVVLWVIWLERKSIFLEDEPIDFGS